MHTPIRATENILCCLNNSVKQQIALEGRSNY